MKKSGIFVKVFVYTLIFSIVLVGVTAALFLQQLKTYYAHYQAQKIVNSYRDLVDRARDKSDIGELAQQFYERNQSFQFSITDRGGRVVYKTPGATLSDGATNLLTPGVSGVDSSSVMVKLDKDYNLHALRDDVFVISYDRWIVRAALIAAALLATCILGAFIFARQMTKPIRLLADTTGKMAHREEVPPPQERKDELGDLTRDVYAMYGRLQETISVLEDEILRERALEETQRYFFSAASHELKTPLAATSVLLEGMLANVGDYKDHPRYLRECMKLMDAQSKTISEMLEIINLSNGAIVPFSENIILSDVIADILPDFQIVSEAKGQRIVTDIPEEQTCHTDPKLLKKVLANVILNAVQNTPDGGEIRITGEVSGGYCRLCVLNTGVQIDDIKLSKLFDPFYRIDTARSQESGRSGLGLTLVRKTLETMDIRFCLHNISSGVLFWMDIPRA